MNSGYLMNDVVKFFKTARHLWGRCPSCGSLFRLSEAAISSSGEAPRDWLRNLERQQATIAQERQKLDEREGELEEWGSQLRETERDLRGRERNLDRDARARVREMLRSDAAMKTVLRDANNAAIKRSRATLLGKLLECIAPCFRKFGYDPRDMRAICNPIDYVLFDGLTVERQVNEIRFIEVKCGSSRLTSAQKSIRDAVEGRRVEWEVWEVGDPKIPITQQLSATNARRALGDASTD